MNISCFMTDLTVASAVVTGSRPAVFFLWDSNTFKFCHQPLIFAIIVWFSSISACFISRSCVISLPISFVKYNNVNGVRMALNM